MEGKIDFELRKLLSSSISDGLKRAETLLVDDDNKSFEEYWTFCKDRAYCGACYNRFPLLSIFVHCLTCSNDPISCFCLDCFLKGKHQGHDFLVFQSDSNCDCGKLRYNDNGMECSCHHGFYKYPISKFLSKTQAMKALSVFSTVFDYMKETFPSNESSNIMKWILKFFWFGDGFVRIISKLFADSFQHFYLKICSIPVPNNLKNVYDDFIEISTKMMVDPFFNDFYIDFFNIIYQVLSKQQTESKNYDIFFIYSKLFFSTYIYPDNATKILLNDSFFSRFIDTMIPLLKNSFKESINTEKCISLLNCIEYKIEGIINFAINGRIFFFNSSKLKESLMHLFETFQFQKIAQRKTGIHEIDDDSSYFYFYSCNLFLQSLINSLYKCSLLLNIPAKLLDTIKAFPKTLSDEVFDINAYNKKFENDISLLSENSKANKKETIHEKKSIDDIYTVYITDAFLNSIKPTSLSTEDLTLLFSFLDEAKRSLDKWIVKQKIGIVETSFFQADELQYVYALNPYIDPFSFSIPLHIYFFTIFFALSHYYNIPFQTIFENLEKNSPRKYQLEQIPDNDNQKMHVETSFALIYLIHPLEVLNATLLSQSHAYIRNCESLTYVLNELAASNFFRELFNCIFGISQICLGKEDNFIKFLTLVIHSFGLSPWFSDNDTIIYGNKQLNKSLNTIACEEENITENEKNDLENFPLKEQVALLIRYLIICLSNQVSFQMNLSTNEEITYFARHLMWRSPIQERDLKMVLKKDFRSFNAIIKDFTIIYNGTLKLKSDEGLTPFFIYYSNSMFFDTISLCVKKDQSKILPIPQIEKANGISKIIETKEFYAFMFKLCSKLPELNDDTTTRCYISLLYMCLQFKIPKFAESLFLKSKLKDGSEESIIEILTKMNRPELHVIFDFTMENFEALRPLISSLKDTIALKEKKKPDKKLIMEQFKNRMNKFVMANKDIDDINDESISDENNDLSYNNNINEIYYNDENINNNNTREEQDSDDELSNYFHDNDDIECVVCKKKMKFGVDTFGVFSFYLDTDTLDQTADLCSPIFTHCLHFAHFKCGNEANECPICRTMTNMIFLVSGKMKYQIRPKKFCFITLSFFRTMELLFRVSNPALFKNKDDNDINSNLQMTNIHTTDKIIAKAILSIIDKIQIPSNQSFIEFLKTNDQEKFLSGREKPIPKFVLRIVNFVLELRNRPLITNVKSLPYQFNPCEKLPCYLFNLPHEFYKIFLKDGSNDEIDGIFHQKATVCKCLLCGVTCTKAKAYHHVCYECPYSFGLFIILNGEDASTVYYMHTTPIKWGTIYLTELGTENIGLLLFENIYLSEEKVKKLGYELFSGQLMKSIRNVFIENFNNDNDEGENNSGDDDNNENGADDHDLTLNQLETPDFY